MERTQACLMAENLIGEILEGVSNIFFGVRLRLLKKLRKILVLVVREGFSGGDSFVRIGPMLSWSDHYQLKSESGGWAID